MRYVPTNVSAPGHVRCCGSILMAAARCQPYRMWLEIAMEALEIEDFSWHCLRHTFASRLVMSGVDVRTVAELMGHKSLQMTMR